MKKYKYCPYCGKHLKKFKDFYKCLSCKKKTFAISSPGVGAFVVDNGKYLISRRAIEPKKGFYDVIGGFLKNGEHPESGILREFKEETGLDIEIFDLLGIYMDKYEYQGGFMNTLNFCYLVRIIGGNIKAKDDISSLQWFPIEKTPKNLAFSWNEKALTDLRARLKK